MFISHISLSTGFISLIIFKLATRQFRFSLWRLRSFSEGLSVASNFHSSNVSIQSAEGSKYGQWTGIGGR